MGSHEFIDGSPLVSRARDIAHYNFRAIEEILSANVQT
jgi:hypothetical protein